MTDFTFDKLYDLSLKVVTRRHADRATFSDCYVVGSGALKNRFLFATVRLWERVERICGGDLVELAPLLPLVESHHLKLQFSKGDR
jgi:hypothetical protein